MYEVKPVEEEFSHLNKYFPGDKLTIVFTGAMAGDRSPSFFLEPLQQLINENAELTKKINVIFAGEADF